MALTHQRIALTTAPALLSSSFSGRDGQALMIQNPLANATVYLGGAGLSASNYGYALEAGSTMSIQLQINEELFGVVAGSSYTVNVIRQGA